MPTQRQIELDEAFGIEAEAANWEDDPDKIARKVSKQVGASVDEIRAAVLAVLNQ
jgi:hypothetical protein